MVERFPLRKDVTEGILATIVFNGGLPRRNPSEADLLKPSEDDALELARL